MCVVIVSFQNIAFPLHVSFQFILFYYSILNINYFSVFVIWCWTHEQTSFSLVSIMRFNQLKKYERTCTRMTLQGLQKHNIEFLKISRGLMF